MYNFINKLNAARVLPEKVNVAQIVSNPPHVYEN
jgi:hypothetical protein